MTQNRGAVVLFQRAMEKSRDARLTKVELKRQ